MQFNEPGQSYASGGSLGVTLGSGGSISTSGDGAWGILAQSIGGGGGFLGDPSLSLQAPVSQTLTLISSKNNSYANGGTVNLNLAGNIRTSGSNAHGVVVQSIGNGGGIVSGYQYDPSANVVMGNAPQFNNNSASRTYSGGMNTISIDQSGGVINTTGPGSIGILAQGSGALGQDATN
jgi:hypothetical protein